MGKVSHSAGVVVQQPCVGGQVERSAVYLCAAGIQCAEHGALAGVGCGQRFQRRDRGAERFAREGKALDRSQPNAQAGEAAGAGIDAEQVDVLAGQAAEPEAAVDEGHQRLAVGHPGIQIALIQQAVALHQGHADGLSGGVHG